MRRYESKCYVYYGPGDVRTETHEIICGPTGIVLKIEICGRCGTDRRLYVKSSPDVITPTVLGHELVGTVEEVGSNVHTLTQGIGYKEGITLKEEELVPPIGSRVTVQPRAARHWNGLMLMRDPVQNLSFCIPGAFSQYMKVPEEMIRAGAIIPVPENVSDEEASLLEPASCVLESIYTIPHATGVDEEGRHLVHSGIKKDGRTIIIGSGPLALIYAQLAKIEGASEIWLIVRSQAKVDLVTKVLGRWPKSHIVADYSDLPLREKLNREELLVSELTDLTEGQLFDDVILACPSADAQRLLFHLLNPDGYGAVSLFAGLHESSEDVNVDLIHYRIAKATGTSGCSTRTMETLLSWLSTGKLSLSGFTYPHHYSLDNDPEEFFQTKADGRKPMLYPWE